jgi:diamine N-acetyltransferase
VEDLHIERVTPENVRLACALALRPGQDRFVASVAQSLAEAYAQPAHAWPRLVHAGSRLVGFVMGGFVPGHPLMTSTIWRLAIAADAQGNGYGRFAVRAVASEAARRGHQILTTAYVRGPGSPEGFYHHLGFQPTGRSEQGMFEAATEVERLLAEDQ